MPLQVQPVELADFDTMLTHTDEPLGDLVAPLLPVTWPVKTPEDAKARNEWSMAQQRKQFTDDPTAHFVKVVDDASGEIVSLARWHYYAHGYRNDEHTHWEIDAFAAPDDVSGGGLPSGMNGALHAGLLRDLCETRNEYCASGPCWILTTLTTRKGFYRRGAGGLLVAWGGAQADAQNLPCFIEASKMGLSLYLKHGYKSIGQTVIDLNKWGIPSETALERLRREPVAL